MPPVVFSIMDSLYCINFTLTYVDFFILVYTLTYIDFIVLPIRLTYADYHTHKKRGSVQLDRTPFLIAVLMIQYSELLKL